MEIRDRCCWLHDRYAPHPERGRPFPRSPRGGNPDVSHFLLGAGGTPAAEPRDGGRRRVSLGSDGRPPAGVLVRSPRCRRGCRTGFLGHSLDRSPPGGRIAGIQTGVRPLPDPGLCLRCRWLPELIDTNLTGGSGFARTWSTTTTRSLCVVWKEVGARCLLRRFWGPGLLCVRWVPRSVGSSGQAPKKSTDSPTRIPNSTPRARNHADPDDHRHHATQHRSPAPFHTISKIAVGDRAATRPKFSAHGLRCAASRAAARSHHRRCPGRAFSRNPARDTRERRVVRG